MIYKRIRELREEHNYTKTYVSKILGISPSTYTRYENGEVDFSAIIIFILSKLYNVSIDYILERTDLRELLK